MRTCTDRVACIYNAHKHDLYYLEAECTIWPFCGGGSVMIKLELHFCTMKSHWLSLSLVCSPGTHCRVQNMSSSLLSQVLGQAVPHSWNTFPSGHCCSGDSVGHSSLLTHFLPSSTVPAGQKQSESWSVDISMVHVCFHWGTVPSYNYTYKSTSLVCSPCTHCLVQNVSSSLLSQVFGQAVPHSWNTFPSGHCCSVGHSSSLTHFLPSSTVPAGQKQSESWSIPMVCFHWGTVYAVPSYNYKALDSTYVS